MKIRQLESYSTGNPQSYPQLLGITLGQLNINDYSGSQNQDNRLRYTLS